MLSWLQKIKEFFLNIFRVEIKGEETQKPHIKKQQPPVFFDEFITVEKTPNNDSLREKQLVNVIYKNIPRWSMFNCPCGCGATISLPLQQMHSPHWHVKKSPNGRPTLSPSIWQNKGCMSHFWIKDGRVYWCENSGIEPSDAYPKIYTKK